MAQKRFQMHAESKRVLVVEDDPDTREMMAELVALLGHDVRVAATGKEALAVFEGFRPDIALVDLGLPDISGHEVARQMRAVRAAGELLIVAVSGRSQPDDIAHSFASGMDLHLVKPIGQAQLRRILDHPAREARAERRRPVVLRAV